MLINYDLAPYMADSGLIFFYSSVIGYFLLLVSIRLSKKKYNNSRLNTLMPVFFTFLIAMTHIVVGVIIQEKNISSGIIGLSVFVIIVFIVLSIVLKHNENVFHLNRPKSGNYSILNFITSSSLSPDVKISGKFSKTSGIITFEDITESKKIKFLDEIVENDMVIVSRSSLENMLMVYLFIILVFIFEYLNLSIFFYTFIK